MTKQNEAARSDAPAKRAEGKEEAANAKLIADAREIAKANAEAAEEQLENQRQYDERNAEVLRRSRANRQQGA